MSNLKQQMADFQVEFESGAAPYHVQPEQVATMHRFDDELRATGIVDNAPRPGETFPPFSLPNQNDEAVSLAQLLERGPVVVSFFRGVWCPYCNLELRALQAALPEIEATGATLVAVSPQLLASNRQAVRQNALSFDILSDKGNTLADQLGIAYRLGEELIEKVYDAFGTRLPQFNGDDSWRLPLSARYIIDTDGTIVAADADVNYRSRPEPDETLAMLKAITRRTVS